MTLINIIIPTHNRADHLKKSVESVFLQAKDSRFDFDLTVVDDCSSDETPHLLKDLQKNSPIPFFIEKLKENRGVSFARNLGAWKSKERDPFGKGGKYLAFLDSDDEWLEGKLKKQVDFFLENPNLRICHTNEIWIRRGVRINQKKKHLKAMGDQAFFQSLKLCCISPSTVMLERELFEEMKGFREDFEVCEDYDLWLKITSKYPVGFLDEFLIKKYGGHEDQLSQKYFAMDLWRIRSIRDLLKEKEGQLGKEQKEAAISWYNHLYQILEKGMRKHGRLKELEEFNSL